MSDSSLPDPDLSPESNAAASVSGGVNLNARGDVSVGGDVVGRDKITTIGYTVEEVSTLLAQIRNTFQPKPFDGRCPYLGLEAFSEDTADRFFGREALVNELVMRITAARSLVIAGPSGSGKSSLVRAGVLHRLKQGAIVNSDRWSYATLTPGRDPIESLALAMSRLAKSPEAGDYVRRHALETATLSKLAESVVGDGPERRVVIFVDQFEEVFTQVSQEAERSAFLNLLTQAVAVHTGRVTLLLALRSDFVSNCAAYPQLNTLLNQQFIQVGAMQTAELVSAIARPALQVGLRIDPDLVTQIVNDMQNEPGALPLMQFALKDLFDAQPAGGGVTALTLDDYLSRGGLHHALARHADTAFALLHESEQQSAQTIFISLIETGRGTQDTRRTARFDELVSAAVDAAQVKVVVQKLADARLITTDEQYHQTTITLAHETLIEAWPWLRRLVNENREAIALLNQITEDASEWENHQRDASYLYVGARLFNAHEQLAARKIELGNLAQTFIEAGIKTHEMTRQQEDARRQRELDDAHKLAEAEKLRAEEQVRSAAKLRRRAVFLIGALGVALLLGIVASVFGIQSNNLAARNAEIARTAQTEADARATAEGVARNKQAEAEQQARIAFTRQLAAQSIAQMTDQYELGLLLSLEAIRLADTSGDTYEGRNSLLSALEYNSHLTAFVRGQSALISKLAFSPNGKILAVGDIDNKIILWDVVSRQPLGEPLVGHTDWVNSVAFSPDGKMLASGSSDSSIILWDVDSRQPLGGPLAGHTDSVKSVAFSPDGTTLASGSADGSTILWDVSSRRQLGEPLLGHTGWVSSVAFSPDGKMLASGGVDNDVILWDVVNRQQLSEPLSGHTSSVIGVAFSPDGRTLASGSYDKSVILWDVVSRQQLGEPLRGHTDVVLSVAFSPDGKTLASGSGDQSIILWDVVSHQRLGEPLSGHTGAVNTLIFSPNGRTLVSGSGSTRVILWDVANDQRLGEPLTGHLGSLESVTFRPNGKTLAASGGSDRISLWDVPSHQQLGEPLRSPAGLVSSVAFDPDGKILAAGTEGGSIILWDVTSRQQIGEPLTGHLGPLESLAFSPDGGTLASGGEDKRIIMWDVANRQRLGEPLTGHTEKVSSLAFSPDGKALASGSWDSNIILWDVANRQRLGEPLSTDTYKLSSVAFSPDGKILASGSVDSRIILWNVASRQQSGEPLSGSTDPVSSVTFSPDGKTLAAGNWNNSVILWDVVSRQRLGKPLTGHTNEVSSVAFSPDGKLLASSGWDGIVMLWDVDLESWKERACQIVARNLTRVEWKQYLGNEPYHKTCERWPEGE
jgi:WD40 repeat protein/energy-coupling factor transporter ATP-binding protein EcfA2